MKPLLAAAGLALLASLSACTSQPGFDPAPTSEFPMPVEDPVFEEDPGIYEENPDENDVPVEDPGMYDDETPPYEEDPGMYEDDEFDTPRIKPHRSTRRR